ncbi:MAG: hypothetical protein P8M22_08295 [Phycisphaerales bacterium]|nr:hypothetical protein [Phycisphaerales bacterium]
MFYRSARCLYVQALLIIAIVAIVVQLPTNAQANTSGTTPPWGDTEPWIIPQSLLDTEYPPAAEDWLRFGWDTFIAMNWPHDEATGTPGAPDTNGDIITSYNSPANYPATAWWSYNGKFQLFYKMDPGTPNADLYPGEWDNPLSPKPMLEGHQIIGDFAKAGNLNNRLRDQLDEAFIDAPLIDRYGNFVLYQIFVNQSFWEYTINTGYYDGTTQAEAATATPSTFVPMPKYGDPRDHSATGAPWYGDLPDYARQGAMSVKVAWRQLNQTEADSGRYYTREVYYENNTLDPQDICSGENSEPITVGLVGMHILRLTPLTGSTWFWSSFEHVDNVQGDPIAGTVPSFNWNCSTASSGYTRRGTCTDAVAIIESEPWLPEYPPANADDPSNYPDGLCNPQNSDSISQIYRIEETQAIMNQSPVQTVNAEYQAALAGTPWQYYEQINTTQPRSATKNSNCNCFVAPHPDNKVNTCDMTNTSMESYSQYNFLSTTSLQSELAPISNFDNRQAMNCINCHAFSAPIGAPVVSNPADPTWQYLPADSSMQVFTFLLGGATSSCPTDIDLSGTVDIEDMLLTIEGWGDCEDEYCDHDSNGDGTTNIDDLLGVLNNWGGCTN